MLSGIGYPVYLYTGTWILLHNVELIIMATVKLIKVLKVFYLSFFRDELLLKGVYEMGFNAPSKIQEAALPTLLANP